MAMIFKCVRAKGWNLPEGYRGLHVSAQTVFNLTLNETYRVHGLAVFNGGLCALVVNDAELPGWYPVEAFVVVDGALPTDWRFGLRNEDGPTGTQALWGYAELINDPNHDEALSECDASAMSIFFEAVRRNKD